MNTKLRKKAKNNFEKYFFQIDKLCSFSRKKNNQKCDKI